MTKLLADALADTGYVEARHEYSGRGMYGKETSAVVYGSLHDLMKAVIEVVCDAEDHGVDEIMTAIEACNWRTDSMGRDEITY